MMHKINAPILPRPLRPGGTVGLVAPSGAVRAPDGLERAIESVRQQGFKPVVGDSCGQAYGYLAGPDEVRARDINNMFADDSVDAIFCIRGGYGAPRILHMLDYNMISHNPKRLLGYSDVTALHSALLQHAGLISFHGPMPVSDWIQASFDPFSMWHLQKMLCGSIRGPLENPPGHPPMQTLSGGRCEGRLVGGNLTLVSALCGTPYELDADGTIVFLEDLCEKTYRIDHMLTQLRLSGLFEQCAGVVFGQFVNCSIEHPGFGLDLMEIIRDIVLPCGKPVLFGLEAGHGQPSLTLPLGATCRMDADARTLTIVA